MGLGSIAVLVTVASGLVMIVVMVRLGSIAVLVTVASGSLMVVVRVVLGSSSITELLTVK